jgi:hypothetical protein
MGRAVIHEWFVIGLDDTDAAGVPGTGTLARKLVERIESDGFGTSLGVTRHKLWDGHGVKATDTNVAYALALETERDVLDVEDLAIDFVRSGAAREANPGVAVLSRHSDIPHANAFGFRAQTSLLNVGEAERYAAEANVLVRGLGGSRAGMIGALAAAGLRAVGRDGRFSELRGIRKLTGRVTAGEIRITTPIEHIIDEDGYELDRDDPIDTFDWIRPRVEEGAPILRVRRSPENRHLWLPADRPEFGHGE